MVLWLIIALFGFRELNAVVWFWAMASAFWSAMAIHYYSAKNTYFYFRNAGYRMRKVIGLTFLADVLIFSIIAAVYYVIRSLTGR